MQQIGMILGNKLGDGLGSLEAENHVIEDESLQTGLIDDCLLNCLSFLDAHRI
jgi:hypothetical protein